MQKLHDSFRPLPDEVRKPFAARKGPIKPITIAKTFQPVVIATGVVCAIAAKRAWTLVRHQRARMWVHWADNKLPSSVKKGGYVIFIGRLRTYNLGTKFDICNAVLLTKKPHAIVAGLMKVLPDALHESPEATGR